MGLAHPSICPYGAFATKDGALVLISIQNEREWVTFCAAFLDAPDLPRQPGFESNNIRVANRAMVDERVGQTFAGLTRDEAAAKLRASNTAYGFVNDLAALSHHPALRRTPVALPGGGVAEIVAPAVIRVGETLDLGAVPAIGQNSAAIREKFGLIPRSRTVPARQPSAEPDAVVARGMRSVREDPAAGPPLPTSPARGGRCPAWSPAPPPPPLPACGCG